MRIKALYFECGDGCPQCRTLRTKFIAECKRLGIEYETLDLEKNKPIFKAYGVWSIPYVVVLGDGTLKERGVAPDMIAKLKDYVEL